MPVITLALALPVPSIAAAPVKVRFSTLADRVKGPRRVPRRCRTASSAATSTADDMEVLIERLSPRPPSVCPAPAPPSSVLPSPLAVYRCRRHHCRSCEAVVWPVTWLPPFSARGRRRRQAPSPRRQQAGQRRTGVGSVARKPAKAPSQMLRLARPRRLVLSDIPLNFLICPKVLVQKNQSYLALAALRCAYDFA